MACHFTATEGWEKPVVVDGVFFPDRGLDLGIDAAGNAVVLYGRVEEWSIDLRAARYEATSGRWRDFGIVSRSGAVADSPSISVTPDGHVTAVWREGPEDIVLARTLTTGPTWDSPVLISVDDGFHKLAPSVATAANGEGAVVYGGQSLSGTAKTVWLTRIDSEGPIGAPIQQQAALGEVVTTEVAVAQDGTAMATWEQDKTMWYSYAQEGQWQLPDTAEPSETSAFAPVIAAADSGNFFVAWRLWWDIRVRRFVASEQLWGNIESFHRYATNRASRPSLAASPDGKAWVTWYEEVYIWMSRFAPDSGWGPTEQISIELEPNASPLHGPKLAAGADGTLVIVWVDGTDVWSWVETP